MLGLNEIKSLLASTLDKLNTIDSINISDDVFKEIKDIIESGQTPKDFDRAQSFLTEIFCFACEFRNLEIIELLTSKDIEFKITGDINKTPLMHACDLGYQDAVEFLISKGADVNRRDDKGRTPLIYAIRNRNVDIVKTLLNNNAEVNLVDQEGNSPVYYAVLNELRDVLEQLIASGADINLANSEKQTPISLAVSLVSGNQEIVDLLIRNKADPNIPDKYGYTPLHNVVYRDDIDITKLLIKSGANVNAVEKRGFTPISFASKNKNDEMVILLAENGADIENKNREGETALLLATLGEGRYDLIDYLIKKGANVNVVNIYGYSPLLTSTSNRNLDVTKLLLINGADLNHVDDSGATSLHIAVCNKQIEMIDLLLSNGADINCLDKNKNSPLSIAFDRSDVKTLKHLLKKGADIRKSGIGPSTIIPHNKNGLEVTKIIQNELVRRNIEHVDLLKKEISNINFEEEIKNIEDYLCERLGGTGGPSNYLYINKSDKDFTYQLNLNSKIRDKLKEYIIFDKILQNIDISYLIKINNLESEGFRIKIENNYSNKIIIYCNESRIEFPIDKLPYSYDEKYKYLEVVKKEIENRNRTKRSIEEEVIHILMEELAKTQTSIRLKRISDSDSESIKNIIHFYRDELPKLVKDGSVKQVTKDSFDKFIKEIQEYKSDLLVKIIPLYEDLVEGGNQHIRDFLVSREDLTKDLRGYISSGQDLDGYIKEKIEQFKSKVTEVDLHEIDELKRILSEVIRLSNDKINEIKSPKYQSDILKEKLKREKRGQKLREVTEVVDVEKLTKDIEILEAQIKEIEFNKTKEEEERLKAKRESENKQDNNKAPKKSRTKNAKPEIKDNKKLNITQSLCEKLKDIYDIDKQLYNIMKISGRLSQYYRDIKDQENCKRFGNLRHYIVHNPFGASNVLIDEMDELKDGLLRASNGNDINKINFSNVIEQILGQNKSYKKNSNSQDFDEIYNNIIKSEDTEMTKYNIIKLCEFEDKILIEKLGKDNYKSFKDIRNDIAHDYRSEEFSNITSEKLNRFLLKVNRGFVNMIEGKPSTSSQIAYC